MENTKVTANEGVGTDGSDEVQNPLYNHLILARVLANVKNLTDLKNCRLVHSAWTADASKFLKNKSVVKLTKNFVKTSQKDNMDVLSELEFFQPQNLMLFPKDFDTENWTVVKKLIQNLGYGVKYIDFDNTELSRRDELNVRLTMFDYTIKKIVTHSFADILQFNLPSLVHISFGDSDFSWPDPPLTPNNFVKRIDWVMEPFTCYVLDPRHAINLVEGVFQFAPSIELLKLQRNRSTTSRYGYSTTAQKYDQPIRIREPPAHVNIFIEYINNNPASCPNLKDLILDNISASDIFALSKMEIKLRSLKLSKLPAMENYVAFEELLKKCQGTLKTLRFAFPSTEDETAPVPHFTFPSLPNLQKLKLVHNYDSYRMSFEDVDYAKQFPVLRKLGIKYIREGCRIQDRIWFMCPAYGAFLPLYPGDMVKEPCRTLQVLKLPYPSHPEFKPEDDDLFGIRERLSIMFPNVHNVHLDSGRARVAAGYPYLPSET